MKFRTSIVSVGLLLWSLLLYAQQANAGANTAAKAATFTIITFDAPNAATGPFLGTSPASINPQGEITGDYIDLNFMLHGFLRESDGTFTSFDAPNAPDGTAPVSINPGGEIVGTYLNFATGFVVHGFLRKRDGTFTTFDAPTADSSIIPVGINPAGEITGYYFGADFQDHGFLRRRDGTFITFDVPAATGEGQYTVPASINPGERLRDTTWTQTL